MIGDALYYKYKDDPVRSNFVVKGINWWDVEIVKDDGNGHAIPHETQLSKEEIDTAIVGTRNPEHLRSNIDLFNNHLPIDDSVIKELYKRWNELDDGWIGQM